MLSSLILPLLVTSVVEPAIGPDQFQQGRRCKTNTYLPNPNDIVTNLANQVLRIDRNIADICKTNKNVVINELFLKNIYILTLKLPQFDSKTSQIKTRGRSIYINASRYYKFIYIKILPYIVDIESITWKFNDGILTVLMPYKVSLQAKTAINCQRKINRKIKNVPNESNYKKKVRRKRGLLSDLGGVLRKAVSRVTGKKAKKQALEKYQQKYDNNASTRAGANVVPIVNTQGDNGATGIIAKKPVPEANDSIKTPTKAPLVSEQDASDRVTNNADTTVKEPGNKVTAETGVNATALPNAQGNDAIKHKTANDDAIAAAQENNATSRKGVKSIPKAKTGTVKEKKAGLLTGLGGILGNTVSEATGKKPATASNNNTKTTTKAPVIIEKDASERAADDANTTANEPGNKKTAETDVNATALPNSKSYDATTRNSDIDNVTATTQENNATTEKGVNSIPRTRTGTDREKKPGLFTGLGGVLGNTVSGATRIIAKKPVSETNESTKTTNKARVLIEKHAGDRAADDTDITANEQSNKITAETKVNAQGNNAMKHKTAKDDATKAARENYATSGKGDNSNHQNKDGTDKKKKSGLLPGLEGDLGNTVSAATGIISKKPTTESDNNTKTTTKAPVISEKDASERAADDANATENEPGNKRTAETGVNAKAFPNTQGKDATTRTSVKDSAPAAAQENNATTEKDVNSIPRTRKGTDKKKKPGLLTGLGGILGNTVSGATGIITKKPVPDTNESTKTTKKAPVLNEKDTSDSAADDADTTVNEPGNKTTAETNVNANALPNAQGNNAMKQKTAKDDATEAARENYATLGKGVNSIPQNEAGTDKKNKSRLLAGLGGVLGSTVSGATGIIAKKPANEFNNNTKTTTKAPVISEKDASERVVDDANTAENESGNKRTAETRVNATALLNAQGKDATTRTNVKHSATIAAQENNATTEKDVNFIPKTKAGTDKENKPGLLKGLGGVLGKTVSGATGIIAKKPPTKSKNNTKTTTKAPVISEKDASKRAAHDDNTAANKSGNKATAEKGINATALPNEKGNDATTRKNDIDNVTTTAQENNATTEKSINSIPKTKAGTDKEKKPGLLTGLGRVLGNTVSGATGIIAKKLATESNNNTKTTTKAPVISEKDASERAADDANATENEPGNKRNAKTRVNATALHYAQVKDATTQTSVKNSATAAPQENNATTEKDINFIPKTKAGTDKENKPGLLTGLGGVLGKTVSRTTGIIAKKPVPETNDSTKTMTKAPVLSEKDVSNRAAEKADTTANEPGNKTTTKTNVNTNALPNAQGNNAIKQKTVNDDATEAAQENYASSRKGVNSIPQNKAGTDKQKKPGLLTGLGGVLGKTVSGATGIIAKKPPTESKNNTKTTPKAPVISQKVASERAADDADTTANEPGNKATAETGVNATALPNAKGNDSTTRKSDIENFTATAQENNATTDKGVDFIPKTKAGTDKEKKPGLLTGLGGVLGNTVFGATGIIAKKPATESNNKTKTTTKAPLISEKDASERAADDANTTSNKQGNKATAETGVNATALPNAKGNYATTRKSDIDNVTATEQENNATTEKSVNFNPKTKAGTDKEKKPGLLTGLGLVLGNTVSGATGIIAKKPATKSNNNKNAITKTPVISEKDASKRAADDAKTTANEPGNKATAETGVNATALPNAKSKNTIKQKIINDTETAPAQENNATSGKGVNFSPQNKAGTDKKKNPGLLTGLGGVLGKTVFGTTEISAKKPAPEKHDSIKTKNTKIQVASEKNKRPKAGVSATIYADGLGKKETTEKGINGIANAQGNNVTTRKSVNDTATAAAQENKATAETDVNATAFPEAQGNDVTTQKTVNDNATAAAQENIAISGKGVKNIPKAKSSTDNEKTTGLLSGLGGVLGKTVSRATGIIAKKPVSETNDSTKTTTKTPVLSEKHASDRAADGADTTTNGTGNKATAETNVNVIALPNARSNNGIKQKTINDTETQENNATLGKGINSIPQNKAGTEKKKKPGLLTGLGSILGNTVSGATGISTKKPAPEKHDSIKTNTKLQVTSEKKQSTKEGFNATASAYKPGNKGSAEKGMNGITNAKGNSATKRKSVNDTATAAAPKNKATAETGVNTTAFSEAQGNDVITQKTVNDTATAAAQENDAISGKGVKNIPKAKSSTDNEKTTGLLSGLGGVLGKTVSRATGIIAKKPVPETNDSTKTNTKAPALSEKDASDRAAEDIATTANGTGNKTTAETNVNAIALPNARSNNGIKQKTINDTATAAAQENDVTLGKGINSIPQNKAGTEKKKKPGLLTGLGSILGNTVSGATGISTKKPAPEKHDSIKTNTKAQVTSEKTESTKDGFNATASTDEPGNKETAEKGMNVITNGQGNNATTRKTVNDTATAAAQEIDAQENDATSGKGVNSIPQNKAGTDKKKKPGLLAGLGGILGNTVSGVTGISAKKPAPEKHDRIKTDTKAQVTSEKNERPKAVFNANASAGGPGYNETAVKGMNGIANAQGNNATIRKSVNDTATAAAQENKATAETGVNATAFPEAQDNDVATQKIVNETATVATQGNNATSGKGVKNIPSAKAGRDKEKTTGLLTGLGGILGKTVSGATGIIAKKPVPETNDSTKTAIKAPILSAKDASDRAAEDADTTNNGTGNKATAAKNMNSIALPKAKNSNAIKQKTINDTATAATQENNATSGKGVNFIPRNKAGPDKKKNPGLLTGLGGILGNTISGATGINAKKLAPEKYDGIKNNTKKQVKSTKNERVNTGVNAIASLDGLGNKETTEKGMNVITNGQGNNATTQKTVNDTATAAAQENIATLGSVKNIPKAKSSTDNEKTTGLLTGLGGVLGKTVSKTTGIIAKKPVPETNDGTKTTTEAPVLSEKDVIERAADDANTTANGSDNKATSERGENATAIPKALGNDAITQKTANDPATASALENSANSRKAAKSIPEAKAGTDKIKKPGQFTGSGGVLANAVSPIATEIIATEIQENTKTTTGAVLNSERKKGASDTPIVDAPSRNLTSRPSIHKSVASNEPGNKVTLRVGVSDSVRANEQITAKNKDITKTTKGASVTSENNVSARTGSDSTIIGDTPGKNATASENVNANDTANKHSNKATTKASVISEKDASERLGKKATAETDVNATAVRNAHGNNLISRNSVNDPASAASQKNNATLGNVVNSIPETPAPKTNDSTKTTTKAPALSEKDAFERSSARADGTGNELSKEATAETGVNSTVDPNAQENNAITGTSVAQENNATSGKVANSIPEKPDPKTKDSTKTTTKAPDAEGDDVTTRTNVNNTDTTSTQKNSANSVKDVNVTAISEAPGNEVNARSGDNSTTTAYAKDDNATTETSVNASAIPAARGNNTTADKIVKNISKDKAGATKKKKRGLLTGLGGVLGKTVSGVTGIVSKKKAPGKRDDAKTSASAPVVKKNKEAGVNAKNSTTVKGKNATAGASVNSQSNNLTGNAGVKATIITDASGNKATARSGANSITTANAQGDNATTETGVNASGIPAARGSNATADKVVNTISNDKIGPTKKKKPGLLTGLGGVLGKTVSGVTGIVSKKKAPGKRDDAKTTASAPVVKKNKETGVNAKNSTNVKGKNATAGASVNSQSNNLTGNAGVKATIITDASGNKATARSGANSITTANAQGDNATTETSVNASGIPAARGSNATADKVVNTISNDKIGPTKKKKPGLLTGLGGVLGKTVSGVTGIVAKKPAPERHNNTVATIRAPAASENDASSSSNATAETSVNATAIPATRGSNATADKVVDTISKDQVDDTKKKKPGLLTGLGGVLGKTVSGVTGIVAKKPAPERHNNTVVTIRSPGASGNNATADKIVDTISKDKVVDTKKNKPGLLTGLGGVLGKTISGVTGIVAKKPAPERHNNTVVTIRSPGASGNNATADKIVDTISKDKVVDTKKNKPGLLTGLGGVLGKTVSGVTGIVAKKSAPERHNNTVATIRSPGTSGNNTTADKVADTISRDKVGDTKKKKPGLLTGLGGVLGKTVSGVTGIVAKKPAPERHNKTVATIRSSGASENNATADKVVDTISRDKVGDTKKKKPGLLTGLGGVLGKTISGVTGIIANKPAPEKHNNTVATIRSSGASENNATADKVVDTISRDKVGDTKKKKPGLLTGLGGVLGKTISGVTGIIAKKPAIRSPGASGNNASASSNATAGQGSNSPLEGETGATKVKNPGLLTRLGRLIGKTVSGTTRIIAKTPTPEKHNNTETNTRIPPKKNTKPKKRIRSKFLLRLLDTGEFTLESVVNIGSAFTKTLMGPRGRAMAYERARKKKNEQNMKLNGERTG